MTANSGQRPQTLTIEVRGTPTGQGNHRRNRAGVVYETTKGHASWRAAVIHATRKAIAAARWTTLDGPVSLSIRPGAPLRGTRDEAKADHCAWTAARRVSAS